MTYDYMQYICILSFVNDIANPGYYLGNMHLILAFRFVG